MKLWNLTAKLALAVLISSGLVSMTKAAQGDMGTGVPVFGVYSAAANPTPYMIIWYLENATTPLPSGCSYLILSSGTMGMESYKIAASMLITARSTNRRVKFYAHAPRDDGCGVDYMQLQ